MKELTRLVSLFRPYWAWMALATLLALAAVLANIALMAVSGWFIAAMGLAGVAGAAINYFTPAAIIRALAITRTGGRYGERIVGHEATLRLVAALRSWLFTRLAPLGLPGLRSGDVLARLRSDIDRVEAVFLRLAIPAAVALLASLVVLAVLVAYLPWLSATVLVLLLAAGAVVPIFTARAGREPAERLAVGTARLNNLVVDAVEGLAELHAHGAAEAQARRIVAQSERLIADEAETVRLTALSQAASVLAAGLAIVAALALAAPAVADRRLSPADLPMLALLAFAAFEALAGMPLAAHWLGATLASARRIFAAVDAPVPVPEPAQPRRLPASDRLVLEGVTASYPGALRPALRDIDLVLEPARRVAVIGHSGAGKSTLVNLLLRFVDPAAGRVMLGGVDVRELCSDDVRSRLAVVEQRPHLFAATIAENLRLARPDATDAEIEHACRVAQLHDFIVAEPRGYATFIGAQGFQLSGGQARRLAVARALLKPAPLLLLDEPTEGLDAATARALLDAVLDARREQGVLLMTHRAAALHRMDEIVVLEAGRVVKRGSPALVLARNGEGVGLDDAFDPDCDTGAMTGAGAGTQW